MDTGVDPAPWASDAVVAIVALLASAAATAAMRLVAIRLQLLAEPNRRSSHATPIPTAGGLGFSLPIFGYLILCVESYPPALVLAVSGAMIAAVGFIDDIKDLRRRVRLGIHFIVATGCVVFVADETVIGAAILILALAWWINLYNFMDGIDGIAASQAVIYAGGALAIGDLDQSTGLAWVLVAACAAFLCFNWAPAKIFMGDTGSGFLGVMIGVFAIWLWQSGELPPVPSLILLVGFWFDASYTLGVRIVTGQPFADAHRLHLYQILSRHLGHGKATALFWGHALVWLAPLAGVAVAFPDWQLLCLIVACVPLACACGVFKAGVHRAD